MRNLTRKFIRHSLAIGRVGVICFALLALVLAGASAAMRLDKQAQKQIVTELPSVQASLNQVPDENSPVAENMSPGSRPNGEPAAVLNQLLVSSGVSYEQVKYRPLSCKGWAGFVSELRHQFDHPIRTFGCVNSELARSLTLVGAKPDGTS